jgi:hypothetical protein
MTVADLIELLREQDPNADVLIWGEIRDYAATELEVTNKGVVLA